VRRTLAARAEQRYRKGMRSMLLGFTLSLTVAIEACGRGATPQTQASPAAKGALPVDASSETAFTESAARLLEAAGADIHVTIVDTLQLDVAAPHAPRMRVPLRGVWEQCQDDAAACDPELRKAVATVIGLVRDGHDQRARNRVETTTARKPLPRNGAARSYGEAPSVSVAPPPAIPKSAEIAPAAPPADTSAATITKMNDSMGRMGSATLTSVARPNFTTTEMTWPRSP